jgi:hypothetical protein
MQHNVEEMAVQVASLPLVHVAPRSSPIPISPEVLLAVETTEDEVEAVVVEVVADDELLVAADAYNTRKLSATTVKADLIGVVVYLY